MNAEDALRCFSTVGADFGTTRFPRYAKEVQLDRRGVSEDGGLVVLIHKQLGCLVLGRYVSFPCTKAASNGLIGGMAIETAYQACPSQVSRGGMTRLGAYGLSMFPVAKQSRADQDLWKRCDSDM
jgi:hypothetical protein